MSVCQLVKRESRVPNKRVERLRVGVYCWIAIATVLQLFAPYLARVNV